MPQVPKEREQLEGKNVVDGQFCVKCGHRVTGAFCSRCGTRVAAPAFVPVPAAAATPAPRSVVVVVNQKSSGLAALLSFFWSGLGQIYNGQVFKGLLMMVCLPLLVGLGWALAFGGALFGGAANATPHDVQAAGAMAIVGMFVLFCAVVIWVTGIIGAYQTAERFNREQHARVLR